MIFQAYQTFTEFNNTGMDGLFLYPASVVPSFIPLVLFALFVITLMATFFSQKRLSGRGDFLASFSVASFFTAVIAFSMTLVDGLISLPTLVITVAVAIIGVVLLITGKEKL